MRGNKLRVVIISMVFAMLGVLTMQAYWLLHSYRTKSEEFDRNVIAALQRLNSKLERREQAGFAKVALSFTDSFPDSKVRMRFVSTSVNTLRDSVFTRLPQAEKVLVIKRDTLITAINDTHPAGLMINQVNQRHTEEVYHTAEQIGRLNKKTGEMQDVIRQMVIEMEQKGEPLLSRLPKDTLLFLLKHELLESGLPGEVDIRLIDENKKEVYRGGASDVSGKKYTVGLFTNSIERKPAALSISFPGRNKQVLSSVVGLFSLAVFFTLFILFTFIMAVRLMMRQKKINDIRNDFINNMTHEFKTPLATIGIAADALAIAGVQQEKDKIQYYTQKIKEENIRLNEQVEQVLQMALVEKTNPAGDAQFLEAGALVKEVAERFSINVTNAGGTVTLQLPEEEWMVRGNKFHLLKAMGNVMDNAIKYSQKVNITVGACRVNHEVRITFKDSGIGMSGTEVKKIFERFYRVPTGNIHAVKGFGLGLSYANEVIQAHGGRIEVTSTPGHGSQFNIYLPCQ